MHLQIAILQNQHSGRDTHIRQVKIFAPREYSHVSPEDRAKGHGVQFPLFHTPEMTQYLFIR